MTHEISIGDRVTAVFAPRIIDDLAEEAKAFIGSIGVFEAYWRIEDGETYAGEWAMKIPSSWGLQEAVWVPDGDLRRQ